MKLILFGILALSLTAQTINSNVAWEATTRQIRKSMIHTPKNAGTLQAAIDKSVGGDEIHLAAGKVYSGNFVLPGKSSVVTIRTADLSWSTLGQRVKPSDAPRMARVQSPNSTPAFMLGANADSWQFVGLEMVASSATHTYNVIQIGDLDYVRTLEELPNNITIERCYIHGDPMLGGRRGVLAMGTNITVRDSWIEGFFHSGADTQGILISEGKGPFLVENNYIEGAGENVIISAEAPFLVGQFPENITIRRNHLKKRLAWKPPVGIVLKNLFEIKSAKHLLVEGNVMENNWESGQSGYGILFTCRYRNGGVPCEISDVKFRLNKIINSANGINILGKDGEGAATDIGRVFDLFIEDNLFEGEVGRFLLLLNGIENVTVRRNTATRVASSIWLSDGPMGGRIDFLNNAIGRGQYGIHHSGTGEGTRSIVAFWREYSVTGNVFIGPDAPGYYPDGNMFVADSAALPAGVGVDLATLNAAIAGVIQ